MCARVPLIMRSRIGTGSGYSIARVGVILGLGNYDFMTRRLLELIDFEVGR